jgi:stage II sporulation protein D
LKRIVVFISFLIMLIFLIPLIILGAVGPGIKIPAIINDAVAGEDDEDKTGNIEYNDLNVKVYIDEEDKVVEMKLEDYVVGVVAAEMPALFEEEALKAQAVAARTYVFAKLRAKGGAGCSKHEGADVCTEVHCQAWISKEDRFKAWGAEQSEELWEKINKVVSETKGLVLTYEGEVARSIQYHAVSGGKTEDSIDVFGTSIPYLKSVDSPGEEESSSYTSTVTLESKDFIDRIKKLNSAVIIDTSKSLLSQISITQLTTGGRVKSIQIGNKSFSGIDIRWAMGLKSANFSVKADSSSVIFNVKGYGHGLGMSQWGAREMAKTGSTYDVILKHYYQGVEIMKISDIG